MTTTGHKPVVLEDDPRLIVKDIKYHGETGDVLAYFVRPKRDEKLAGVIVIHENRGLFPILGML